MKMKMLIEVRCRSGEHKGREATRNTVQKEYKWHKLWKNVNEFIRYCIDCILSWAGDRALQPILTALHGQKTNKVVHMNFLILGDAEGTDLKYILVLKEDLKRATWLLPFAYPYSKTATGGLYRWISAFGAVVWIVTNRGSHFIAEVMKGLTCDSKINHHLTTAYRLWAIGKVERLCKKKYCEQRKHCCLNGSSLRNDGHPSSSAYKLSSTTHIRRDWEDMRTATLGWPIRGILWAQSERRWYKADAFRRTPKAKIWLNREGQAQWQE